MLSSITKRFQKFFPDKNLKGFFVKGTDLQKKTEDIGLGSIHSEKRSDLHVEKMVVKNQEQSINQLSQTAKKVMLFSVSVIFAITLASILTGNFLSAKISQKSYLNDLKNFASGLSCEHSYPDSCTPEKTFHYYKLAADNGNPFAQYKVASAYRNGKWVQKNEELSIKYATLSANQGIVEAKRMLKGIESPNIFRILDSDGNLIRH